MAYIELPTEVKVRVIKHEHPAVIKGRQLRARNRQKFEHRELRKEYGIHKPELVIIWIVIASALYFGFKFVMNFWS